MLSYFTRNWWMVALRGLLAVLFGLAAILWPGLTLPILVFLFGFFMLADGVSNLIMGVRSRKVHEGWWAFLLEGLVGVGVGIAALIWPAITAVVMVYMIAFWAIATGVLEIVVAIYLRKELKGEWLMVLSGILSVVFGGILIASPGPGLLAMVWLIGAYAIFVGFLLIGLGFRLRKMKQATYGARDRAGTSSVGAPDTLAHG